MIRTPVITDTQISGFFGEYRWLSNFHLAPVRHEGILYPSSEHAYQAAKYPLWQRTECLMMTPSQAKRWGGRAKLPAGWDEHRLTMMREVVLDKFTRNTDLRVRLLDTGDRTLVETNDWGDRFWGVDGHGANHLGQVLMGVRTLLRAAP